MTQGLGWRLFEDIAEATDETQGDKAIWLRSDGTVLFGEPEDLPDAYDDWTELTARRWADLCYRAGVRRD